MCRHRPMLQTSVPLGHVSLSKPDWQYHGGNHYVIFRVVSDSALAVNRRWGNHHTFFRVVSDSELAVNTIMFNHDTLR